VHRIAIGFLCLTVAGFARAGGGPLDVAVLYNGADPDAEAVAQHYADVRSIPEGHLCPIAGIDPDEREIPFADFWTLVHQPLNACLDALPLGSEVDYLVVVRGLPYRVVLDDDGYYTSLSAMLQVHEAGHWVTGELLAGEPQEHHVDYYSASVTNPVYVEGTCLAGDFTVENDYWSWYTSACGVVRTYAHPPSFQRATVDENVPWTFGDNLFVVTRLDGFDYADAMDLVDRGAAADGTFPTAEILCMAAADSARGGRDPECEFVTRFLALAGLPGAWLSPHDATLAGHELAAYFTGAAELTEAIDGNTYVPGAIACNVTSYGAVPGNFFCDETGATCPETESQTSIARFVRAGATGAHGAVAEPLNNVFPNAGTLLYYTFGYNLGESFLFNQRFLYWQNLLLGDPLTTPYAERPTVSFAADLVPQGGVLTVAADHPDGVGSLRLFVAGVLVAEVDDEALEWVVEGDAGSELDLFAVAVADNVLVNLPGWPEDQQLPQPDVQGWMHGTLTVGEPIPSDDDDDSADDDTADDDDDVATSGGGDDCRCRAGTGPRAPEAVLALIAALAAVRRRRRSAGRSKGN